MPLSQSLQWCSAKAIPLMLEQRQRLFNATNGNSSPLHRSAYDTRNEENTIGAQITPADGSRARTHHTYTNGNCTIKKGDVSKFSTTVQRVHSFQHFPPRNRLPYVALDTTRSKSSEGLSTVVTGPLAHKLIRSCPQSQQSPYF